MYPKSSISIRIQKRRKELGLSQTKLAERMANDISLIDIQRKMISKWECERATPGTDSLLLLCNALECDMEYLLGVIDTPRKAVHDVKKETGLSSNAVQNILGFKSKGGDAGIAILSALLEDADFWNAIMHINYAKYAESGRLIPMSPDLEEAVGIVQMQNSVERNPNAVIMNADQMRDMNAYHAGQKISACIARIVNDNSAKNGKPKL